MEDLKAKKNETHDIKGEILDHMDSIIGWGKEQMSMFEEEPVHSGDQFMACKPWKGAIKKPTVEPLKEDASLCDMSLEFDFVHGYKSDECYQNCLYNTLGQPVYQTACLGIILDTANRTQKIFGGGEELSDPSAAKQSNTGRKQETKGRFGHPDDVRSLFLSKDKTTCLTGSSGREPYLFTWDTTTAEQKELICLPRGCRSVSALAMDDNC